MKIFHLPDLGEGLPSAEIREWHIKVGDHIKTDQLMVSVETAKAVVEVPAPRSGVVTKLYGKPGDIIDTHAPLVEFEDGDEAKKPDAGTVAGSLTVGNTVLEEPAMGLATKSASSAIRAIPAVRALARKLNVDLETVTPTGPNQQITAADVENASRATAAPADAKDYEPLHGVRRSMALAMIQSHTEVVPVTLFDDADLHQWPKDTDITLRVIRALVAACQAEPALNAWYNNKVMGRKLIDKVDLGLAMDSTEGLFVPVLKDVAHYAPSDLRAQINTYKEQVKARTIPAENLRGFSIILSNFGNFAGRYATPIIVPPTVAIVGTGRIREEVVAHNGTPSVHRMLPISLTFDHRAVTGGEATRFLSAMIKDLSAAS